MLSLLSCRWQCLPHLLGFSTPCLAASPQLLALPSLHLQRRKTRKGSEKQDKGSREHPQGSKKQGGKGLKNKVRGQKNHGSEKQVSRGYKNMQELKKHGQGSKKHWAHLINKKYLFYI